MEDKLEKEETPRLTKKERLQRQWEKQHRELKIKRIRAGVIRNQTLKAYNILDEIRFDYLSDTMFRNYYTSAKKALESAFNDFLLHDEYWVKRIKEHKNMTPEKYEEYLTTEPSIPQKPIKA